MENTVSVSYVIPVDTATGFEDLVYIYISTISFCPPGVRRFVQTVCFSQTSLQGCHRISGLEIGLRGSICGMR